MKDIKRGAEPKIIITDEEIKHQAVTIGKILGSRLYDQVFNYGYGTVSIYVTKTEDDNESDAVLVIFITYSNAKFVSEVCGNQTNYRYSDECGLGVIAEIAKHI